MRPTKPEPNSSIVLGSGMVSGLGTAGANAKLLIGEVPMVPITVPIGVAGLMVTSDASVPLGTLSAIPNRVPPEITFIDFEKARFGKGCIPLHANDLTDFKVQGTRDSFDQTQFENHESHLVIRFPPGRGRVPSWAPQTDRSGSPVGLFD